MKKTILFLLSLCISLPLKPVIQSITQLKTHDKELIIIGTLNLSEKTTDDLFRDRYMLQNMVQNWALDAKKTGMFIQPNIAKTLDTNSKGVSVIPRVHVHETLFAVDSKGLGAIKMIPQTIISTKMFLFSAMLDLLGNNRKPEATADEQLSTIKSFLAKLPICQAQFMPVLGELYEIIGLLLHAKTQYQADSPEARALNKYLTYLDTHVSNFEYYFSCAKLTEETTIHDILLNYFEQLLTEPDAQQQFTNHSDYCKAILDTVKKALAELAIIWQYKNNDRIVIMAEQATAAHIILSWNTGFNAQIATAKGSLELPTDAKSRFSDTLLFELLQHLAPVAAINKCSRSGCKSGKINNIQRCTQCKKVGYCSQDCQKLDWAQHKIICEFTKNK